MINHKEVIIVNTKSVSCSGGDGASGHPKIYLQIKETPNNKETNNQITCPYCSKIFIYKEEEK
jgi:uncharacterized Zn-finger protein